MSDDNQLTQEETVPSSKVTTSITQTDIEAQDIVDVTKPPKRKRTVNYLNNADLLIQVKASKEKGRMTDELAKMLTLLCQRYASKGNFAGYTYNDDMQAYALASLCKSWSRFDADKGTNPFAYYTQCIKNSFKMYLGIEKNHRNLRDALLIANGMTPSHTYQIENGMEPEEGRSYQFEPISRQDHYEGEAD